MSFTPSVFLNKESLNLNYLASLHTGIGSFKRNETWRSRLKRFPTSYFVWIRLPSKLPQHNLSTLECTSYLRRNDSFWNCTTCLSLHMTLCNRTRCDKTTGDESYSARLRNWYYQFDDKVDSHRWIVTSLISLLTEEFQLISDALKTRIATECKLAYELRY